MAEFVSGSFDSIVFWDAKTFTKKKTAQPFPDSACHLSSLSWNSTNTKIAVIPKEAESVALGDIQDDTLTWSYIPRQESNFTCGCLLQNSRYLATGSKDTSVHVWDLKNKSIFRTFPGHTSHVKSLALARSHNDHWIVSGGEDGAILMHTVDNTTSHHLLQSPSQQPNSAINRLCFSHVEKYQFGSVGEDGVVCIWSVESQRLLHKYSAPHTGPASDLCFSPSNNMLMISVGMDSKIKCYDIQTRKIVTEVSSPSPLTSVTMLRDGSTLLAGSADGKLYVYELRTVKYPKNTLVAHKTAVTCVVQQSYTKSSSRKSSKSSSSSKGKHTPSNHDSASPTPPPIDLTTSSPSLTNHHHHQKQPHKVEGSDSATPPLNSKAGNKKSKDHSLSITPTGQSASKRSHSLKDSVNITPFVTTSSAPGASGGGSGEGSKGDVGVTGGGVLGNGGESMATPALFTPASHRMAQTSSIFSPIDPNLITPITTTRATTATTTAPPTALDHTPSSTSSSHPLTTRSQAQPSSAHPTASSSPITTRSHIQQASSSLTHPTSTSSSSHPSSSAHPTSSSSPHPSTHAQPAATPTATPMGSGETSGIFSPLESSRTVSSALLRHQPVASPLLIARTERGVSKGAGVEPRSVGMASSGDYTDGIQHSVSDEGRIPMSEHAPGNTATGRATSQTQLTQMLEKQTGLDTPTLRSSHTLSSTHSMLDSASSSSADLLSSTALSLDPPPPAPPIPTSSSSIQMKFIENTIRDAHEETLQTLHQDIRALSVDTIKLFCSLQQQSAAQHAALMDKVDKLSRDLQRVEEMVHQYMPKH